MSGYMTRLRRTKENTTAAKFIIQYYMRDSADARYPRVSDCADCQAVALIAKFFKLDLDEVLKGLT